MLSAAKHLGIESISHAVTGKEPPIVMLSAAKHLRAPARALSRVYIERSEMLRVTLKDLVGERQWEWKKRDEKATMSGQADA